MHRLQPNPPTIRTHHHIRDAKTPNLGVETTGDRLVGVETHRDGDRLGGGEEVARTDEATGCVGLGEELEGEDEGFAEVVGAVPQCYAAGGG